MAFMKSLMSKSMKADCANGVMLRARNLMREAAEDVGGSMELNMPQAFVLTNPLARFPTGEGAWEVATRCVAEGIYLLSGMNTNDFIWEFRGWDDPRRYTRVEPATFGTSLRFHNFRISTVPYDYRNVSVLLRGDNKHDYIDQLAIAVERLKLDKMANVFIPLSTVLNPMDVLGLWFHERCGVLDMVISCGKLEYGESMIYSILSPLAFLHQLIADMVGIGLGRTIIAAECLWSKKDTDWTFIPAVKDVSSMQDFRYPDGHLSIKDINMLVLLMIEFASRLDERSIERGNPFAGDSKVQVFNDYAEVIRAWKAERIGRKDVRGKGICHPQLRKIFGEGSAR